MPANTHILLPVFALAGWTGLVLLLIPYQRIRAMKRGKVRAEDFKLGESTAVPAEVSIPNRNYMNLLEVPVLFYVISLILFIAALNTPLLLNLAWAYVVLRIAHSLIHLTYNKVLHRFLVFAASNAVLVVLWIATGLALFSATPV